MAKCELCDSEIEGNAKEPEETECNGRENCRCRTCREILGIIKPEKDTAGKVKVPINSSDYPLPGFMLSEDKKHYTHIP